MTSYTGQLQQLNSVPLAVVRRQVSASELSRVVPECCGLVWNAVRAQQAQAGRNVAIYWDGSIRLDVGLEIYGTFSEGHGEQLQDLRSKLQGSSTPERHPDRGRRHRE
jgi:hypothetical protein